MISKLHSEYNETLSELCKSNETSKTATINWSAWVLSDDQIQIKEQQQLKVEQPQNQQQPIKKSKIVLAKPQNRNIQPKLSTQALQERNLVLPIDYLQVQLRQGITDNNKGLSKQQIQNLSEEILINPTEKSTVYDKLKCAICLGDFEIRERARKLLCLHVFHSKCVDPWLQHTATCPLCRDNICKK